MVGQCKCECSCKGSNRIIYACSGASNVGQLANELAKVLVKEKKGIMSCGIALGANHNSFIITAQNTDNNFIIDGCPVGCLKKVFNNHNIKNYCQIVLTDFGCTKNKNLDIDFEQLNNLREKIKSII